MVNMTDTASEAAATIEIEKMSIDQFAGSVVLILGAVGSLLLVIWQSRCAIHCRLGCSDKCYICDCKRDPPPTEGADDDDDDELPEGDVAKANTSKRVIKVPPADRLVPEEIRRGTFPERDSADDMLSANEDEGEGVETIMPITSSKP